MKLNNIVACICEGGAEQAIMEILLENNLLIFNELLDDKIIRERSAEKFEANYLRRGFSEKISIVRILDSRSEGFRLRKQYKDKVDVINVVTAPEIEILIILYEDRYEDYKRSNFKKPSDYCKLKLRYESVKNYQFVKNYFADVEKLKSAITRYKSTRKIPKGEYTLFDILKIVDSK